MQQLDGFFKRMPAGAVLLIGIVMVLVLGFIDFSTGEELSLSIFYLIPILFAAWFAGRRPAMLLAVMSSAVWFLTDIKQGREYSHIFYFLWDMVMRLGFLFVLAYFVTENRRLLEQESVMARTDALTGVANRRAFLDALEAELKRVERYERSMSIAYLDVDNFKQVNDTQGHEAGDRLLMSITMTLRARIRSTDLIGHLGGDEFAVLMPETEEQEAQEVIDDVRARLLEAMHAENWPATFSIGVLTCHNDACVAEDVIKTADRLMYEVKQAGKNSVRHEAIRKQPASGRPARERRRA